LTGLQRWRRILARAFQVFLQGRQLRSPHASRPADPQPLVEKAKQSADHPTPTAVFRLNVMPGSSSWNSCSNSSVSLSLVSPAGHSSNGFSGANSSTFENGDASLPLSGRPCWDTTVMISGCRQPDRRRQRRADPIISFLEGRQEFAAKTGRQHTCPNQEGQSHRNRNRAMGEGPSQHRRIDRTQDPDHDGLRLLNMLGQQQRRQNRRHGERRDQSA